MTGEGGGPVVVMSHSVEFPTYVNACHYAYLLTDESKSSSNDEGNSSSPSTLECFTSHAGEPAQDVHCTPALDKLQKEVVAPQA